MKLAIYKDKQRTIIEIDNRIVPLLAQLDYDNLISLNKNKLLKLNSIEDIRNINYSNSKVPIKVVNNYINKSHYCICNFINKILNLFNFKKWKI